MGERLSEPTLLLKPIINKYTNTMSKLSSKVTDKLIKLLNLSDPTNGSTPGEQQNAIAAANRIMSKHNITREDVDMAAEDPTRNVDYGRVNSWSASSKLFKWENLLSHFITKFIPSVGAYLSQKETVRRNGMVELDNKTDEPRMAVPITFYGSVDDVAAANELFDELQQSIMAMALIRWGSWSAGDGGAYAEGFVYGLISANEQALLECNMEAKEYELMLQSDETALALVNGGEQWLAEKHGIKLRKGSGPRGASGDDGARAEGRRDGGNYSVNKPSGQKRLM